MERRMSRTLNKVMLIGNVGKEPELKHTPSGIPVISFRMATSETWKDRDNNFKEHTDWHTVVAWRGLAEVVNKLVKKGSKVFVEGKIRTRVFDDKSGNRKQVVEILADSLLLLDSRKHRDKDSEYNYDDKDNSSDSDYSGDDDYESYDNYDESSKEIPF